MSASPQTCKAITLMAMSGVGKTYLSRLLSVSGWYHYSCDYMIGTKYLGEEIIATLSKERGKPVINDITPSDLSLLSAYVGQIGKGALGLEEFQRRQKLYYEAECRALTGVEEAIERAKNDGFVNFVNDSTGSLCEIEDEALLSRLAEDTLFVYIRAEPEQEQALLKRAEATPKPLYFPPEKFAEWLRSYMEEKKLAAEAEIEPDDFSRWVFPKLFHSRLPKYQKLADRYGITIPSARLKGIRSERDFLKVMADAQKS